MGDQDLSITLSNTTAIITMLAWQRELRGFQRGHDQTVVLRFVQNREQGHRSGFENIHLSKGSCAKILGLSVI
jgi:hypothetical protein